MLCSFVLLIKERENVELLSHTMQRNLACVISLFHPLCPLLCKLTDIRVNPKDL